MGKFFRGMRVNPSFVAAVLLRLIVSRAASGTARSMSWASTDVYFPIAQKKQKKRAIHESIRNPHFSQEQTTSAGKRGIVWGIGI